MSETKLDRNGKPLAVGQRVYLLVPAEVTDLRPEVDIINVRPLAEGDLSCVAPQMVEIVDVPVGGATKP